MSRLSQRLLDICWVDYGQLPLLFCERISGEEKWLDNLGPLPSDWAVEFVLADLKEVKSKLQPL